MRAQLLDEPTVSPPSAIGDAIRSLGSAFDGRGEQMIENQYLQRYVGSHLPRLSEHFDVPIPPLMRPEPSQR